MGPKRGLGKGLDALIGAGKIAKADGKSQQPRGATGENSLLVALDNIDTNPHQARKTFEESALQGLSESIKESGLLQPLVVTRSKAGRFILVAGERRLRASRLAGLSKVPVRIVDAPDKKTMAILGLVENLQREDLDPIEEAEAFKELAEKFKLTQQDIALAMAKSRPFIANSLRLLDLPGSIIEMIRDGALSPGHGRAILRLPEVSDRVALAKRIVAKKLSVREAERIAEKMVADREQSKKPAASTKHPHAWIADDLKTRFGTKVEFAGSDSKGRIVIHYFSEQDLTRIIELIKG